MAAIDGHVDLLILNRFGRAESLGRGLLRCFAEAVDAGIPVLTSVREPYDIAWRDFHGGLGIDLAADFEAIVANIAENFIARPSGAHDSPNSDVVGQ